MSFEVFLQCYRDSEPFRFPRAVVEEAFPFADRRDPGCWELKFPDGGRSDLYIDDELEIWNLMVSRLARSPELWTGLFDILRRTGSMLFWPGGGSVVADESVVPHLLPDIIMEPLTVVREGSEILPIIERS
ncbi:MAG TPA: hypothetical protein VF930_11415 [Stellaceae bacterium]